MSKNISSEKDVKKVERKKKTNKDVVSNDVKVDELENKTVTDETTVDEVDTLKTQLEEERIKNEETISELTKKIAEMNNVVQALLSKNNDSQNVSKEENSLNTISIKSNSLYNNRIMTKDANIVADLRFDEYIDVNQSDFEQMVINNKVRRCFELGIYEFEDEQLYKKYKIRKHFVFDKEEILDLILNGKTSQMIEYFDKATERKSSKKSVLIHTLFYFIADMEQDGLLERANRKNIDALEKYFGFELGRAASYTKKAKELV